MTGEHLVTVVEELSASPIAAGEPCSEELPRDEPAPRPVPEPGTTGRAAWPASSHQACR